LLYRKFDQYLLNFMFGEDAGLTSPVTEMARDSVEIPIRKRRAERSTTEPSPGLHHTAGGSASPLSP
jgi:hypothetical protein